MNFQSQLVVSSLLIVLILWILRNFAQGRLGSGQVLFWLTLLAGAMVFTLSPRLVDWLSLIWGNLVPVSWITFLGLISLIAYLLYQAIQINQLHSRYVELARSMAFLEKRLRREESPRDDRSQPPS